MSKRTDFIFVIFAIFEIIYNTNDADKGKQCLLLYKLYVWCLD